MSVAFRRESDEEHLEPRFEIPIAPGPNLVTARGHAQIAAELARLNEKIAATADADAVTALRREHRYWGTRLTTAVVMPPPPSDVVAFGSRVALTLNGATRTLDIVGGDEADAAAGRIAFSAPLARALIDLAPGDTADFAGRSDAIHVTATMAIPDD